ncbi:MAG TPA: exosortase H [Myxococcota bacterium]|nr:exosortase H [Myxococcota bacterium]
MRSRSDDTSDVSSTPDDSSAVPSGRAALVLRVALYLALVLGLSNLLLVEAVDQHLLAHVRNAIAYLAAHVLAPFREGVYADGERVFVGGAAVEIVNGCTGVDVAIFLSSAMLVFPAPWRARLFGVAAAFAIVLVTNFARVLTLCVLNASSPAAFELVHVYVWPASISLVCLATLLGWIRLATAPP